MRKKNAPECAEFRKSNKYYEDWVIVATYEEWGWSEWWQNLTVNTEKKRENKNSSSMRVPILQEMYAQCRIFRLLVQVQQFTFARFYAYKRRVNIVCKPRRHLCCLKARICQQLSPFMDPEDLCLVGKTHIFIESMKKYPSYLVRSFLILDLCYFTLWT